ncbi:hypothetical protein BGZ65_001714 [Modicella reniformis]|uniref:C3H1-type domain-containing protein n=1 Tax=Modicella reniformis TaxID=1440133 RepID=A0A9P6J1R0_9FUNG|nr:hypothetical protein BGZ65_001714 [Modicella reniformis]
MGAAAASAVTATLLQFGSSSSPDATTVTSAPEPPGLYPNQQQPQQQQENEWYSDYHTPTLQQRMAVTMAMNAPSPERFSNGYQNARRNRQRQQQQQQRQQPKSESLEDQGSPATPDAKESTGYHCDTCDVTFHEETKLKIHIAAHRSCPECQYSASPSLVSEHYKLTHGSKKNELVAMAASSSASTSTGTAATGAPASTASSILSMQRSGHPPNTNQKPKPVINPDLLHPLAPTLNTPEEIAAWIAQRRKAWPTEANVQKKEQERQEMIAKGQIVEEPSRRSHGKDKRTRNSSYRDHKGGQQPATASEAEGVSAKKARTEGSASPSAANGESLVAYASSTETSSEEDDDDNEVMDPVRDAVTSKDPTVMGKILLPSDSVTRPKKPCKYFLRGNCTRGNNCTYSHDPSFTNKIQKTNPALSKKDLFRSRPSLLQMLLSGEIKEEKNKLLEAMRYIVENNFFEKQQSSQSLVEEVV